jgi:hypothetical protein
MLEKNPKQRYQSYKEIKDDIEKAKAAGLKKSKETTISAVAVKEAARAKSKFPVAIIYISAVVILFIAIMLFFLKPSATKTGKENKTENEGVDFDAIKKRPGGGSGIAQPFSPPIGTGTFNDGIRGISDAHKVQVISNMRQIYILAITYYNERGVLPDSVETLYQETNTQGLPTRDSWGNQYQLISRDGDDISVISAGPDSSYGTSDDIEIRNGELVGGY